MDVPNDIQQELMQFQQLQEQFQMFSTQRAQMELQLKEINLTVEKLGTVAEGTTIYQNVGSLLVKIDERKTLEDELGDRTETITRRIDSMKGQEERLKQRLESMGNELNEKIKSAGLS